MALEVWYESDIQNAFDAAEQANESALKAGATESNPYVLGYQAGFRSALTTLALAGWCRCNPAPTSQLPGS